MDCLFCKIIDGDIPSTKVYEDEYCYAFRDINPVAPTHILIVPRKHIDGLDTIVAEDKKIIGHIFMIASMLAREEGLKNGYRVITNVLEEGGQSVRHLHFHLIGGKKLNWEF